MKTRISSIVIFACLFTALQAQTPTQINMIKKAINESWVIKTAALTQSKGCVIIGKTNGYKQNGLSENLTKMLKKLQSDGYTIDYVCISPKGQWCIIYNKNRNVVYSKGVPEGLKTDLDDMKTRGYYYKSIAFNDNESFICVGYDKNNKSLAWGSPNYVKRDSSGNSYCAYARTAWMTNKGCVIIYENGSVRYFGTVPTTTKNFVKKYLKTSSNTNGFNISSISFTDLGNTIITDRNGKYRLRSVD